jgi:hypothetical protein
VERLGRFLEHRRSEQVLKRGTESGVAGGLSFKNLGRYSKKELKNIIGIGVGWGRPHVINVKPGSVRLSEDQKRLFFVHEGIDKQIAIEKISLIVRA